MAKSNDNLELKRQVWFAVKRIPIALQPIFGKTKLIESTGVRGAENHHAARVASLPILARMNARLADAHLNAADPIQSEAATLARKFMEAKNADDALFVTLTEAMAFALQTIPRATATDRRQLMARTGNTTVALAAVPGATEAMGLATGTMTAFTVHLDGWKRWAVTGDVHNHAIAPRAMRDYAVILDEFNAMVGKPPEAITSEILVEWMNKLAANGNGHGTIRRKLSALKSYWKYLTRVAKFVDVRKPFADLAPPVKKEGEGTRDGFEPWDLATLLAGATNCQPLHDLIMIAAYTGTRRESICGLKVSDIIPAQFGRPAHFRFRGLGTKTQAGIRETPIHSAIQATVDRLMANPDAEGYLFHDAVKDADGYRGARLGQKFSALKTRLGFTPRQTLHSFRHTVAALLEVALCPPGIAKDFIGHKKQDLTYGVYSGKTPLAVQSEWAEKAIVYPMP